MSAPPTCSVGYAYKRADGTSINHKLHDGQRYCQGWCEFSTGFPQEHDPISADL